MSYYVSLNSENEQYQIEVSGDLNLLEVMRKAGLNVRDACRNGACGVCRCRLIKGDITYHHRFPTALWKRDIEQGFILPCIAFPVTHVTLASLSLKR